MKFGSLFAGIGGFDLGFERAGMQCEWQVEIDDYATKVLERHWPNVRRWRDIRTFPPEPVGEWRVDVVCGGFPCTNISSSGDCSGLAGKDSGLWFDMLRVVRILRPRIVVIENVADVVHRGLATILGCLAKCGFDAEWETLPAAAFGSPQRRPRVFVVAYSDRCRFKGSLQHHSESEANISALTQEGWNYDDGLAAAEHNAAHAAGVVYRMGDVVPNRVDRLRGLGNAVVPQVSQWIGERIMEAAT